LVPKLEKAHATSNIQNIVHPKLQTFEGEGKGTKLTLRMLSTNVQGCRKVLPV
jgi:hypothetical protein